MIFDIFQQICKPYTRLDAPGMSSVNFTEIYSYDTPHGIDIALSHSFTLAVFLDTFTFILIGSFVDMTSEKKSDLNLKIPSHIGVYSTDAVCLAILPTLSVQKLVPLL